MRRFMRVFGGGRRRVIALTAAVVLVAGGAAAIVVGVSLQRSAPQPPASAAQDSRPPASSPDRTSSATASARASPGAAVGPTLSASDPMRIDIPAIDVHHTLMDLGQNPDGSLQVPSLDDVAVPGWDRLSPTPGEQGPAVIVGHVDSAEQGEGVFFDLGDLRPGDTFTITRADHSVAVFRITGVDEYSKDDFPTLKVYGNSRRAEVRLITCGGRFDAESGNYVDNIVAYAQLADSHRSQAP